MFCIYSKVGKDKYRVYDSEDLTLDVCTVDEIRNFLKMDIKIKGVTKLGNSLKITVSPKKSIHVTKEVCSDAMIEMLMLNWCDKDKANLIYNNFRGKVVYTIHKNGKRLAMFVCKITDNVLESELFELLYNNKNNAKEVINFLFNQFSINKITMQTPSYSIEPLELAGAVFYYDLIEQRQYLLENEGLNEFNIIKE